MYLLIKTTGSIMIDRGLYLDFFGGRNLVSGVALGTSDRDKPGDGEVCAYYSLYEHSGVGATAGLLVTISGSNANLSPGVSESSGYSYCGTFLGGMAYTETRDKEDKSKYTKGVSLGAGYGDWGGEVTCSQHSRCLPELFN